MLQSVLQNYKTIFLFQNLAQIYLFYPTFGQDFYIANKSFDVTVLCIKWLYLLSVNPSGVTIVFTT